MVAEGAAAPGKTGRHALIKALRVVSVMAVSITARQAVRGPYLYS
jgi:hypothetical protein